MSWIDSISRHDEKITVVMNIAGKTSKLEFDDFGLPIIDTLIQNIPNFVQIFDGFCLDIGSIYCYFHDNIMEVNNKFTRTVINKSSTVCRGISRVEDIVVVMNRLAKFSIKTGTYAITVSQGVVRIGVIYLSNIQMLNGKHLTSKSLIEFASFMCKPSDRLELVDNIKDCVDRESKLTHND